MVVCIPQKREGVWVWLALCRQTRQVVAFVEGEIVAGRDLRASMASDSQSYKEATCYTARPATQRDLLHSATCYSDFWEAYTHTYTHTEVIPEHQHEARLQGRRPDFKEEGQTSHVQRGGSTPSLQAAAFTLC